MNVMNSLKTFLNTSSNLNKVITENIANANSPNYQAKTLATNASQHGFAMYTTNSMHIKGNKNHTPVKVIKDKEALNFKPNNNNVDLMEQSNKSLKNQLDFSVATKAYKHYKEMISLAIGGAK